MLTRRLLLSGLLTATLPSSVAGGKGATRLLVHGGWRSDCVSDMAQAAGLLALLERELPEVKLMAWTRVLSAEAQQWLETTFPLVEFVTGTTGKDGSPDDGNLAKAWKKADFLLHGTGGGVLAPEHLRGWRKHTGKPFGLYGVTLPKVDEKLGELLSAAKFLYLRDGISRAEMTRAGIAGPLIEFAPDAAFDVRLTRSSDAEIWLAEQGFDQGRFLCVIPRLRHLPYWDIYGRPPHESEQSNVAENERCQHADHQLLVKTLEQLFQTTDLKVLLCAEMPHEVALAREHLAAALPEKWRKRVIVRETIDLPDFRATVFAKANLVLSHELGSALLAVVAGTPAIHVRLPSDDSKGQLWRDIGLKDWIEELADVTPENLTHKILGMLDDPAAQEKLMHEAKAFVRASEIKAMQAMGALF